MRKEPDKRVDLFRVAEFDPSAPGFYMTEHEVISECSILGRAQFGAIRLEPWSHGEFAKGERRFMHLTFPAKAFGFGPGMIDPVKERQHGFDSGLTPIEEFLALTSLFLRRRLWLGATVKVNGNPRRFERRPTPYEPLQEDALHLTELPEFLVQVSALPLKDQHSFILATRFYFQGLRMADEDPALSYLSHVSALESLTSRFKYNLGERDCIEQDTLKAILTIPDQEMRTKTIAKLKHQGRIKATIQRMVEELVDDTFFIANEHPHNWISRENLPHLISNIYRARSRMLHEGRPLPEDVTLTSRYNEEIAFGIPVRRGSIDLANQNKELDPSKNKDRIPLLHAFDRLTNHVLRRFAETRTTGRNTNLKINSI